MPAYPKIKQKPKEAKLTDAQLARHVSQYAPQIWPYKEVISRDRNIRNAAAKANVVIGSGKRCFEHYPCWNLGCLMCRYRAQLNCVKNYRSALKKRKKSKTKKEEKKCQSS